MRAVALAAGLGSRLGSAAQGVPKCMLELAGKPLLERNLEWLAAAGIREVAVNLHPLPELVREHFGDGSSLGLAIRWSYEPELLGTAGTLRSLERWLSGERFLVLYADNLLGLQPAALLALHERRQAAASVALFQRNEVSQSGVAELDGADRIRRFLEKPKPGETDSRWVNAGLLVLEPRTLRHAPAAGDIGRDLLPRLLAAGERLVGYRMGSDEPLFWVDTPADLARTRAALEGVGA